MINECTGRPIIKVYIEMRRFRVETLGLVYVVWASSCVCEELINRMHVRLLAHSLARC